MVSIESLGAVTVRKVSQGNDALEALLRKGKTRPDKTVDSPPATADHAANTGENSSLPLDTSQRAIEIAKPGRPERAVKQSERMSLNELAELLRKVNLTFDLFEVQARFSVDSNTGEVTVEVVNQRTGEVLRRIPPYEVQKVADALDQRGAQDPLLMDVEA